MAQCLPGNRASFAACYLIPELNRRFSSPPEANLVDTSSAKILKVLGLTWNNSLDTLMFNLSHLMEFLEQRSDTKPYVLQASACIFDPLGFLASFVIRIKILFQQLWIREITWDESCLPTFYHCGSSGVERFLLYKNY